MLVNKWRKHYFIQHTAMNSLNLMDYRRRLKGNRPCFLIFKMLLEFFSLRLAFSYLCVWCMMGYWIPDNLLDEINNNQSDQFSQTALMGHRRKCYPLGCNYPAGCCAEWPLFLYYLLNPDLMSGLISKSLSAMPIP